MKTKAFAIIFLMALIAMPACAQNGNGFKKGVNNATSTTGEEIKEQEAERSREIRERARNKEQKAGELKSETAGSHRSEVANFVRELLDVADRQALGGIGDQVREIARQQNDSEDKVIPDLEKIKSKGKLRKFFFGTYFDATKEIKKEMQDAEQRLKMLEKIEDGEIDAADKAILEEQIKNFRDEIGRIRAEVKEAEGSFSLFGWVKRMFN